jgi:hypothetical protein
MIMHDVYIMIIIIIIILCHDDDDDDDGLWFAFSDDDGLDGFSFFVSLTQPILLFPSASLSLPLLLPRKDEVHAYLRTVLGELYADDVAQATRIEYGGPVTSR